MGGRSNRYDNAGTGIVPGRLTSLCSEYVVSGQAQTRDERRGSMTDSPNTFEEHLFRAARRILHPLVRILLRNGITAPVFQELARKVFVDVARDEFPPDGKAQTLANISVITGLNRKEVARLAKEDEFGDGDKIAWTRCGKVLDGWLTDASFQSAAGFPLDLPFTGLQGSFVALVKRYSGDMYPAPIRDELLRVGAIVEIDGKFRMTQRGYVPAKDPTAKVDILGSDTSEFIETIDHNIQSDTEPLLQYKVLADNLPKEHLAAFNAYSRRVSEHAIDDIRRWLIEHDAGSEPSAGTERFFAGVGVYQINRKNPARQPKRDEDHED